MVLVRRFLSLRSLRDVAKWVLIFAGFLSQPASAQTGNDPTVGVLPPYDDVSANWANAGMQSVGGIPTRTTICATVNPLGGGQDDFTNIQNAINACPAGQIVQLGAGAFSLHIADLPIQISTGITLRGTGNCSGSSSPFCQTSITVSDGALAYTGGKCGTSTSNQVACPNGGPAVIQMSPVNPSYNYSWAKCGSIGFNLGTGCGAVALTADAAQGQTTVSVASTSGFSAGQWVLIDEASGAGWVADPLNQWTGYGSVWAASDWLSPSGSPATGRVLWSKSQNGGGWDFGSTFPYQASSVGCWFSYCDRPTAELHKIASIGTGTLTFDDPLTIAFRQSGGHNAQVYSGPYPNQSGTGSPISLLQNAGVENLSVLRGFSGGIRMQLCAYCWIKNTEAGYWYGGGIDVAYSARSELNNVYVHHAADSVNNGGEYPIALDSASTEILITNSITNFGGKGMVARAGGAGSVVSYSYVDDTMYDAESGIGDYWLDMGLNASHYSGPHHVLFEGNWADNMDSDQTHGNSMYMTFFRNNGTGLRTPFVDPSIPAGSTVDDFTGVGYACGTTGPSGCRMNPPAPLRAAGPMAYNYWFAFVGNVLGLAGETTAANGWTYQGDWSGKRMFMLGWNTGNGGQDPYMNGVSGSYVFRHGNYDYVTNSAQWDSSTPDHTLPNSFYLSSAPSFFGGTSCTYPWPWVTPTGSTQIQTNSCGGSGLPAKARWDAGTPLCVECSRGASHDFNGDGMSDILWRNSSGNIAIWLMNGTQTLNSSTGLGEVSTTWSIAGLGDFNGDGYADILWRDTAGDLAIWEMKGTTVLNSVNAGLGSIPLAWSVVGVGDFNGDGYADILWRDTAGDLAIWEMKGTTILNSGKQRVGNVPTTWSVVDIGDFNGDGMSDILWRDTAGDLAIWEMNGTTILNLDASGLGNVPINWSVNRIGDFNGDGMSDILWRDTAGDLAIWEMSGTTVLNLSTAGVGNASTNWSVIGSGDYNGDRMSDILWADGAGDLAIWEMNGTTILNLAAAGVGTISTTWAVRLPLGE
jgi:FG-GAP-like repeat